MRVRLLIGLSGNEYTLGPGDERDFPDKEAARLVAAGIAVPSGERRVEKAVVVRPAAAEKRARKTKANVVSNNDRDAA